MPTFGKIARMKADAFKVLKEEHRQIKDLFDEFEAAPDIVSQQHIGDQILDRLSVHASLEREIFYPAARHGEPVGDMNNLIDEALGQHEAADRFIEDLGRMVHVDDGYRAAFRMLRENVTQHMAEEEHDIFPRAAKGHANWEQIGAQIQIRKVGLQGSGRDDGNPTAGQGPRGWLRGAPVRALSEKHDQ